MKSLVATPIRKCLIITASLAVGAVALASSHSDAPLIKQDPQANLTDVYGFIGTKYDDPSVKMLNVVVNVRPFSEPGDGPHYERFADDARYSIHITDPATGASAIRYDFFFSAVDGAPLNPDTILSYGLGTEAGPIMQIGDARQNFVQTYSVVRSAGDSKDLIGEGLLVAPPNVGGRVTPLYNDADGRAVSGAADFASLDAYTQQAITDLANGMVVFAGPRDDSFFADVPGVFNLLDPRIIDNNGDPNDGLGQDGNGVDGFKGFNVLTFAIQIPVADLEAAGVPATFENVFFGEQTGVGVYASVSRPQVRELTNDGRRINKGSWIQINRLGNPLFNETLVALRDKDRYNRTSPTGDESFATWAENSELAFLINFVLFGDATGQAPLQTTGRTDLVNIFIPDVLRVITTTDPVRLEGDPDFNRLGFLGGDKTNGVSSGWPNGRRFGDDVVDIALTAIASGPTYGTITLVGDNVEENDVPYNQVFPYAATPHSGSFNRKDPARADMNGAVEGTNAVTSE